MRRTLPLFILFAVILTACGAAQSERTARTPAEWIPSLTWLSSDKPDAATQFTITRSEEGYTLVTVADDGVFLVIPEGQPVPADLQEGVTPLFRPLSDLYMAASAAMDMLVKLDALDAVSFSALPESDWTIPEVKEAMENGVIVYAGKYSAPDYERICAAGCSLTVENTMIYHSPEVKEQLERFGVPVLVDHASREATPQGRMEWIKVYGALLGKEELADAVYETQAKAIHSLGQEDTGRTVVFFYLSSNGEVKVRRSDDYIPQLIRLAGGTYVFDDLEETSGLSTMTLQWEEFYAAARDADVLIYNSTVTESLPDLDALIAKNELFSDFAAVKNGEVYCTKENFYQASMELGDLAVDLHAVFTGEFGELTYLYPLE